MQAGAFFETSNRGVKSVTLNLKAPEGRAILDKLADKAPMPLSEIISSVHFSRLGD